MPPENHSWVVIGNPENRRVEFFRSALAAVGAKQPRVVPWLSFLQEPLEAGALANCLVRIESPGEDFEVERLLLAAGAEAARAEGSPFLSPQQIKGLKFDKGLILHPRQWYLGFRSALQRIRELATPSTRFMSDPDEIALMFDKVACQQHLSDADIPVAPSLPRVRSYDELLARMRAAGERRVFLKIAHGSSASGVVAFRTDGVRQQAITSAELVRNGDEIRLYNSLRLRTYNRPEDIADIINTLCCERVHVERWLPKAAMQGKEFDLRIVVIGGRACQTVVRQSSSPLTNLHLGNQRGDLAEVRQRLGDEWTRIEDTCQRVMTLFPRTLYAGVDIAVGPKFNKHAVLEVNAFGDLLPGVLHEEADTYTAEVRAAMTRKN